MAVDNRACNDGAYVACLCCCVGPEVLPLVQFYLEEGVGDEEAVCLIDLEVPHTEKGSGANWQDRSAGGIL